MKTKMLEKIPQPANFNDIDYEKMKNHFIDLSMNTFQLNYVNVVIQYEANLSKCELKEVKYQKSFDLLPDYSEEIKWVGV